MPKTHTNKQEVKVYFQTHNESIKEVAEHFKIPLRTLSYWVSTEGWEQGSAINGIAGEVLSNNLVKREFGSALRVEGDKIKRQILENLGEDAYSLDSMILNNVLEDSTDKLLLGAMGLNYIQKNIALSAIIARDEILKMKRLAELNPNRADPMIIASAEKVQKIFIDLKSTLYGKEIKQSSNQESLEGLSDEELQEILNA